MAPATSYDQTSGQVFREWTAERPRDALPDPDWARRPAYAPFQRRSGKGVSGARSMVETALSVVADNIGDATERHLENVPPKLLWRIWRFLEAR